MTWKKKYQIIRFLQRTFSLEDHDGLTANQVAHRSATLIERIIEGKDTPIVNLEKELMNSMRIPD